MEFAIPFYGHVVTKESITSNQNAVAPSYATRSFGLITFFEPILLHFHYSRL
jgi:hypothetical protein